MTSAIYAGGPCCTEESQPKAGILEMGGASTQIAFLPTGNILADKFPVRIGPDMYSLYVHSYLDYGQNAIIKNIKNRLEEEKHGQSPIENPCMLIGKIHCVCGFVLAGAKNNNKLRGHRVSK